ncbi:MAG: hypothetical protein GX672_02170 [Synergistaceae bacterium]|nr:hypothetical protein [Synergistaceae bacterium]
MSIIGRKEKNGILAAIGISAARAKHGKYIERLTTEVSGSLIGIVIDLNISRRGSKDTIMPLRLKFLPEKYVCVLSAKSATIIVTSMSTKDEKYPIISKNKLCIVYSTPFFENNATANRRKSKARDRMCEKGKSNHGFIILLLNKLTFCIKRSSSMSSLYLRVVLLLMRLPPVLLFITNVKRQKIPAKRKNILNQAEKFQIKCPVSNVDIIQKLLPDG